MEEEEVLEIWRHYKEESLLGKDIRISSAVKCPFKVCGHKFEVNA